MILMAYIYDLGVYSHVCDTHLSGFNILNWFGEFIIVFGGVGSHPTAATMKSVCVICDLIDALI